MQQTHPFIAARDFLLSHRSDYQQAADGFAWPEMEEFNWALDYFDVMAAGNDQPALQIVNEQGHHESYSFVQLSKRSNQVANYLAELGVRRGDRILLMLGNEVSLWETMLGAFKLGAVVIPASELLVEADLADRLERGKVSFIVTNSRHSHKFQEYLGNVNHAICTDRQEAGWQDYRKAADYAETFNASGVTKVGDPLLLYFTSGTTSKPKLVLHSHQSYPVGSLSTMYWIGLMQGDVHLNISSPGWAKHAWSCFFALECRCLHLHLQQRSLQCPWFTGNAGILSCYQPLCTADRMAHADSGRLALLPRQAVAAGAGRCRRATES